MWVVAEGEEDGKMEYRKVSCPLSRPGFTDQEPSDPDEAKNPITRRYYIEQMEMKEVENVNVTVNGSPVTPDTT